MKLFNKINSLIGVPDDATRHVEKLISAVGGFVGIVLTLWISQYFLGSQGAVLLVASMGASAVLLFAVPHGALSQPWPLLGGHVVSALAGVAVARHVPEVLIAAPLAVALAIAAMHYLRCIHPPGGATALSAVIGGAQVHELGFQFVLTPVLLNVIIMLLAAVALNYAFPWRRYPASLRKQATPNPLPPNSLSQPDFAYALKEIGSYVDVSEDDLGKIYRLAVKHAWQLSDQSELLGAGLYYSNGEQGADLSVRKVVSCDDHDVVYLIVAGYGEGVVKTAARIDFANWQRYEVIPKNGAWYRIRPCQ